MTVYQTRDEFDAADDLTIITRRDTDGIWVAQKQGASWFEAGCSDPFDDGCYREWIGAQVLDPADHAEQRRLAGLADALYERLMQVATFLVAADRTGDTARALTQITALVTADDLPTPAHPELFRSVTCPACEGTGWEQLAGADGYLHTTTCRACYGGDSIRIGGVVR